MQLVYNMFGRYMEPKFHSISFHFSNINLGMQLKYDKTAI